MHNIRSLHNVGSIFRTADAADIEKVYLCGITPTPIDKFGRKKQQISKVALGAEDYVAWEKVKSTARIIDSLKKNGYIILAIEQSKKAIPYYEFDKSLLTSRLAGTPTKRALCKREGKIELPPFTKEGWGGFKIALVLGNEIKGLPHSILNCADKILEIPMRGKKESLNVAVAFGIIVFHLTRRRFNN